MTDKIPMGRCGTLGRTSGHGRVYRFSRLQLYHRFYVSTSQAGAPPIERCLVTPKRLSVKLWLTGDDGTRPFWQRKWPWSGSTGRLRKPPMPVLPDPLAAVRKAIQEPVGAASLDQLAGNARSATIAICDITRPVPNHFFLRPLIEMLSGGMRRRPFGCWWRLACTGPTWEPNWQ